MRCRRSWEVALLAGATVFALANLLLRADVQPCLAVYGEFGQSFNKLIELYKAIKIVQEDASLSFVELDNVVPLTRGTRSLQTWYGWLESFVDVRQSPVPVRAGPVRISPGRCARHVSAEELFTQTPIPLDDVALWARLLPRLDSRPAAVEYLEAVRQASGRDKIATVHSRAFEGGCEWLVSTYGKVDNPKWYCGITEATVRTKILPSRGLNPDEYAVVLLTDGQSPSTDATFHWRFSGTFLQSVWLMILSDVHVGTDASTIHVVVSKWRASGVAGGLGDGVQGAS